ncbi:IS110 family RNA-guided transposase [Lactobacillaceae bacterium Melli_B3]
MKYVIGIDVSKATSQVAVAVKGMVTKQFKISHDVIGFNEINNMIMQLDEFPDIVFEATGVYSRRLKAFLDNHGYPYSYLNPLAAKKQLDQLRPNKNDANDARELAKIQFILERAKTYVQNPIYIELQDISRFYQQINQDIISAKNRLHRVLQLTFPEIESLFTNRDSIQYLEIIQIFPNAYLVNKNCEYVMKIIQDGATRHIGNERLAKLANKIINMASISSPAVRFDSHNNDQVIYYAKRLIELLNAKQDVINQMIALSKDLPEFDIYQSIPGFSDKTVVSLIAELGDLRRFSTPNKLNAFVGIDLRFNDSGEDKSSGFITKRGNKIVRKVLFKSIGNIASTASHGHPSHINDWYQNKKQSSLHYGTKKIAIGAMSRLIRSMHYLVTHNQLYDYQKTIR